MRERGGGGRERGRERDHSVYVFADMVGMIDFEYGGPNYLAYDIANHFCEFAGTVSSLGFFIPNNMLL